MVGIYKSNDRKVESSQLKRIRPDLAILAFSTRDGKKKIQMDTSGLGNWICKIDLKMQKSWVCERIRGKIVK